MYAAEKTKYFATASQVSNVLLIVTTARPIKEDPILTRIRAHLPKRQLFVLRSPGYFASRQNDASTNALMSATENRNLRRLP